MKCLPPDEDLNALKFTVHSVTLAVTVTHFTCSNMTSVTDNAQKSTGVSFRNLCSFVKQVGKNAVTLLVGCS